MFFEGGAELGGEERFFLVGFAGESDKEHGDGEQAAVFADQERSTERCEEQAGVNRVADVSVGARSNQLVAFFDLHFGAPVLADRAAGPDGEEDSCGTEGAAEPGDPQFVGEEAAIERAPIGIFLVEEEEARGHEDDVEHALGGILAFDGALHAESGDEPVEREEEPESAEDLGGSYVHCSRLREI